MKKMIFLLLMAVTIWLVACRKPADKPIVYKGVVVYDVCGNVVVQTLGPEYLGQDNWVDSNNTEYPVYDHVFKVSNTCQFGEHSSGDTIQFRIVKKEPQSCAQCLLYLHTPDTSYPIQVLDSGDKKQ